MKKLTVFILLIALLAFSAQVNAEMIVVYYSEAGAAKTGLSVTIDITDVADGSLDIDDGACTELANGWYKYDFSDDATKNYTWLADGGAGLCDPERYIEGNIYLTTAKVNAESDQAIVDYDPPTDTEMLAAHTTTDALINGIDDNVWDDGTRTLTALDEDDTTFDFDSTTLGTVTTVTSCGTVSSLGTQAKADVNAEVVDGLNVDTYGQRAQGALPATDSIVGKIGDLHKVYRNKTTLTAAGTQSVFNDAGDTVDHKSTITTSGGTTTKTEQVTGP